MLSQKSSVAVSFFLSQICIDLLIMPFYLNFSIFEAHVLADLLMAINSHFFTLQKVSAMDKTQMLEFLELVTGISRTTPLPWPPSPKLTNVARCAYREQREQAQITIEPLMSRSPFNYHTFLIHSLRMAGWKATDVNHGIERVEDHGFRLLHSVILFLAHRILRAD